MGYRLLSAFLFGVDTFSVVLEGEGPFPEFFGEVKAFPLNLGGLLKKLSKTAQKRAENRAEIPILRGSTTFWKTPVVGLGLVHQIKGRS